MGTFSFDVQVSVSGLSLHQRATVEEKAREENVWRAAQDPPLDPLPVGTLEEQLVALEIHLARILTQCMDSYTVQVVDNVVRPRLWADYCNLTDEQKVQAQTFLAEAQPQ